MPPNLWEFYFLVQILFDLLLLLGLSFLFFKFKRLTRLPIEDISERLVLVEKLAKELKKYAEEERKLFERLRLALETGAKAWEASGKDRKSIREKIRELSRQGLSPEEISKRLSLSEGEVELVLSLERFRKGER